MITDFNSGLARVVYVGDEETTEFPFSFTLKNNSELNVRVMQGNINVTGEFTFTVNFSTPKVTFSEDTIPDTTHTIIIYRKTNIAEEAVDFNDISVLRSRDLNTAVEQLFDTIQELQDTQVSLQNIDANVAEAIDDAVNPLDTRIDTLEASQSVQNSNIDDLENRVTYLEENGAGDLGPLTERVTEAEADITALQAADTALDSRLDTAEADINAIEAVNVTQGTAISTQGGTISTHTTQISNHNTRLNGLDVTVADLESYVTGTIADSIADHETRIEALEAGGGGDISALEARVDDLEADNVTNKTDIESLESGLSSHASQLISLDSRLDAAEPSIITLQAEMADTISDVSAINTRVTTAESDIDALQAADTALDSRLDTAESDIVAVEADILTIEGDLTDLASDVATNTSDISSQGTRLTTAESDIDGVQAAAAALDLRMDAEETISADHESRIDTLEASLGPSGLDYDSMSKYMTDKDADRVFTVVEWYDGATLRKDSTLSGGTAPEYTLRTVNFYDTDGTTVLDTVVFSLQYDVDGDLISEES